MRVSPGLFTLIVVLTVSSARADPDAEVRDSAKVEPRSRFTVTLGAGAGYLGGNESSQGAAFRIGLAYRLTERLQLSFDGDFVSFARYEKDPSLSRQVGIMTVGLRYRPFGERSADDTLDLTNLQFRGGIGMGHEILTPYSTVNPFAIQQGEWAPAVAAAVSWLPFHGDRWEAGIELQASYARFAEPQTSVAAMLVFNVDVGPKEPPTKKKLDQVARK